MLFNDAIAGIGAQLMTPMGEPVTLTDGTVLNWIFDAWGELANPPWEDAGLTTRISDQPNPVAYFLAVDNDAVQENDVLIARDNQQYRVVRKYPMDAAHLVKCDLVLLASATADSHVYSSWQ